jgi:putative DNA methylase
LFPTEAEQVAERARLHDLVDRLCCWDNWADEATIKEGRAEIQKYSEGGLPPLLDPFAGGGTVPLAAQRLGFEVHASDLNPVAVLINKALIEIPQLFPNSSPVNPQSRVR